MEALIIYLETRIEVLENLIKMNDGLQAGDYLKLELAICLQQLDRIKVRMNPKFDPNSWMFPQEIVNE